MRTGDDSYRITVAAAGFRPEQLNVTVHQNVLTITGTGTEKENEGQFLYRGIAGRSFERSFNLADFVEVKQASFQDGLLQVELERHVPDAMKPRRIAITGAPSPDPNRKDKTIDHHKAA